MVASLNGHQVRIGTDAPEDIIIRREELPPWEESA